MKPRYNPARQLLTLATSLIPLIISLNLSGCSSDSEASRDRGERTLPSVEAVESRFGGLPLTQRLSGQVKAKNQVELYPQLSADVVQVYARNGELVRSGDPLVRLRDTEFEEQLKQAEADLRIARAQARQAEAENERMQAELQRSEKLAEQDLISPTELETIQTRAVEADADAELARARVSQAEATVEERKEELSKTVIRAPVDGYLGNRNAEIGMLVTPSTRLFTLGQLDSVRVEVILTDRMLTYIEEGQRAEILSDVIPSGVISAPVARISPFLHPVSHSTIAEIDMANPERALKPGMFVPVDIFYGESEQATLVPLSALWENPTTGTVGLYVSTDPISGQPVAQSEENKRDVMTDAISFQFIEVDVIAKGRMSAGVNGVDSGNWVVTLGQDLFASDSGRARVRPVDWEWVEELQKLQREDLLEEILKKQQAGSIDSTRIGMTPVRAEDIRG